MVKFFAILFLLFFGFNITGCKEDDHHRGQNSPPIEDDKGDTTDDIGEKDLPQLTFSNDPLPFLEGKIIFQADKCHLAERISEFAFRFDLPSLIPMYYPSTIDIFSDLIFSSDGLKMAYRNRNDGITVAYTNGFLLYQSKDDISFYDAQKLAWSPDSRFLYYEIIYESFFQPHTLGIYQIDSYRSTLSLHYASKQFYFDHSFTVSPDNRFEVWSEHTRFFHLAILKRSRTPEFLDSEPEVIYRTRGTVRNELQITRFLDNEHIIFKLTYANEKPETVVGLFILNIITGEAQQVFTLPHLTSDFSFSPDMKKAIYRVNYTIYVLDTTTWKSEPIDHYVYILLYGGLQWSPDSSFFIMTNIDSFSQFGSTDVYLYSIAEKKKWILYKLDGFWISSLGWTR